MKRLLALFAGLAILCASVGIYSPATAQTASGQLLNGKQQFQTPAGTPLAAGTVYVYQLGTTTPVTTYQDPGLIAANTFPIYLDGNGQALIWAPPGNYREQVYDANGNLIWDQPASTTGAANALNPGANIGLNGDVTGTPTLFTGAGNILVPTTVLSATSANAGKVQLATNAVAQAGTNAFQAITPATLAGIVQGGTMVFATDTGSANNILVAPTPALTAYTPGTELWVKVANTNTGGTTLTANSLSAEAVTNNGVALTPGQLVGGQVYGFLFDGVHFQLISPAASTVVAQQFNKAYITISGTTPTLAAASGISAVNRTGTGQYNIVFSAVLANTNFVFEVTSSGHSSQVCQEDDSFTRTTSTAGIVCFNGGGNHDPSAISVLVISQ